MNFHILNIHIVKLKHSLIVSYESLLYWIKYFIVEDFEAWNAPEFLQPGHGKSSLDIILTIKTIPAIASSLFG